MWSNARLRDAAAPLAESQLRRAFEIGMGSVWATLVHLYAAELVWLEALRGRADAPLADADSFESFEQLVIAWAALDRRWSRYLDDLTDARLTTTIHKRSTLTGRTHATPVADVLLHVCTHAQYTTAQCVHMLKRLGVEPLPDCQLITMSRHPDGHP